MSAKAQYKLCLVQRAMTDVTGLNPGPQVRNCVHALGMSMRDVVDVIQHLKGQNFQHSLPCDKHPHLGIWHDVYYAVHKGKKLYIKLSVHFQTGDFMLMTFKPRS